MIEKIYTGKEFNKYNELDFYVFSRDEIDNTKKKNRYENKGIEIFPMKRISENFFNKNLYIYKVKILDDSKIILEYFNNEKNKNEKINKDNSSCYIKENFQLIERTKVKEFIKNYENCLMMVKNGLIFNSETIPEKNLTYELVLESVKIKKEKSWNNSSMFHPTMVIPNEFYTRELCNELAKIKCVNTIREIPDNILDNEIIETFIEHNYNDSGFFLYIPQRFQTYELCLKGVRLNGYLLQRIPKNFFTNELYFEAIKNNKEFPVIPGFLNDEMKMEIIKKTPEKIKYFLYISKSLVEEAIKIGKGSLTNTLSFVHKEIFETLESDIFIKAIENETVKVNLNKFDLNRIRNIIPEYFYSHKNCKKLIEKIPQFFFYLPFRFINEKNFLKSIESFNNKIEKIKMEFDENYNPHIAQEIFHPLELNETKYNSTNFLTNELCEEMIYHFPSVIRMIPKKFISYELCYETVLNNKRSMYFNFKLSDIPKEHRSIEICEKMIYKNIKNCIYVPKKSMKAIKNIFIAKPNLFTKIKHYLKSQNNNYENIEIEILIENIYKKPKVFSSIAKQLLNSFGKQFLTKFFNIFFDKRDFFNEKLEEIYKKFSNEYESKLLNDILTIFDVLIIKKWGKENNNFYIINNFIKGINRILTKIENNALVGDSSSPKILENMLRNNPKDIFLIESCNIKKNIIDIIQKYKNAIPIVNQKSKINLVGMEYDEVSNLINIINGKYDYGDYYDYDLDYYNDFLIDKKIKNYDKKKEILYDDNYLKNNYELVDFLLLYFERYRIMKNNNFELSLENFEIPNRQYLKYSRYSPIYLEEIIEYDNGNKIDIKDLTNELKKYVKKFDKTFGNKITKNKVVDSLLEREEWKKNFDNNYLLNYKIKD
jgi:hypothetical protein